MDGICFSTEYENAIKRGGEMIKRMIEKVFVKATQLKELREKLEEAESLLKSQQYGIRDKWSESTELIKRNFELSSLISGNKEKVEKAHIKLRNLEIAGLKREALLNNEIIELQEKLKEATK